MGQTASQRLALLRDAYDEAGNDNNFPFEETTETDRNDLVNVLQYLIRSGVVHVIPQSDDDSDECFFKPKIPHTSKRYKPNLERMEDSEIKMLTLRNTGNYPISNEGGNKKRSSNVVDMIFKRHKGDTGIGFSYAQRCYLNNKYLPNKIDQSVGTYQGRAFTGVFDKSGDKLLIGSQDRNLRVFDSSTSNYKLVRTIQGLNVGWSIIDTAFSSSGDLVAYSSWSKTVHIINLASESEEQEPIELIASPDDRYCAFSLTFSHNAKEILAGANCGGIHIYDLEYKRSALQISGHIDDVNTVCFGDESSNILYSAGDDGICKVWDRRELNEASPKPVGGFVGHRDGITFIDPRGDSRYFISNSKDQTLKLWDVRKFSRESDIRDAHHFVGVIEYDYRREEVPNKLINATKTLMQGDTSVMTYRGHSVLQTLIRCRFSPAFSTGQRYIYTGCAAGRVVIYDVLTGEIENILSGHRLCVRDVSWHPFRPEILSTSWDGTAKKWIYSEGVIDVANSKKFKKSKRAEPTRRSARIAAQRQQLNIENPIPVSSGASDSNSSDDSDLEW